jgi:hypothetical protein
MFFMLIINRPLAICKAKDNVFQEQNLTMTITGCHVNLYKQDLWPNQNKPA